MFTYLLQRRNRISGSNMPLERTWMSNNFINKDVIYHIFSTLFPRTARDMSEESFLISRSPMWYLFYMYTHKHTHTYNVCAYNVPLPLVSGCKLITWTPSVKNVCTSMRRPFPFQFLL